MENETEIKVITQLKNVPIGAIVSKKQGTVLFCVQDGITIWNDKGEKKYIPADEGTRFIITEDTFVVNAVSAECEFIWYTTLDELIDIQESNRYD